VWVIPLVSEWVDRASGLPAIRGAHVPRQLKKTAGKLAAAGTFGQKTESKTPATVRGLYIGENRKADPSPTFASGASGFGMTTAMTENRKTPAPKANPRKAPARPPSAHTHPDN
jgi:hypothetical protein